MGSGKTLTATTFAVLDFIETGRKVIANYRIDLEKINDDGFLRKISLPKFEVFSDGVLLGEVEACHDISAIRKVYKLNPGLKNLQARMIDENTNNHSFVYLDYVKFIEDMKENKEMFDVVLIVDEAYLWADSRLSQTAYSRLLTYFVLQSRKRDVDLYVTTQQFENIDIRLRRNAEARVLTRFNKKTGICTARLLDLRTGMRRRIKIFGPEIYKFYDTKEIPPLQPFHTRITM